MAFELPDLPFDYDALDPHMSADSLRYHHDEHHKGYVDKLNKAVEGTRYSGLELEQVIQEAAQESAGSGIFNNAAQHWNHSFFWRSMRPNGGGQAEGELGRQIEADFGDHDKFTEAFLEAATGQFGSGWAWLVLDGGKLAIVATANAEPPMVRGQQALLTCDVWEHAYYLDYQNRRGDFVKAFLKHLVNWDFVAEQFGRQGEGNSSAARRYREDQEEFAGSGTVKRAAAKARDALKGEEADALEDARKQTAEGRR